MFSFISPQSPSGLFNLEGTLLGFLSQNLEQPESIVLEVEEEIAIGLPTHFSPTSQSALRQSLRPGDRVHCIGCSQINLQAGMVCLRACTLSARGYNADRESVSRME